MDDGTVNGVLPLKACAEPYAPPRARYLGFEYVPGRPVLDHALITAPEARDPQLAQRLSAVAGRVLKRSA